MKKTFRNVLMLATIALQVSGCAGSLFGGAPKGMEDMEEIGVRRANADEEKRLDACLFYLFKKQQSHHRKTGKYIRELEKLNVGDRCEKITLSLESTMDSFVATGRIKDGNTIVKWTVNDQGEVVEQDDMSMDLSL